MTPGVKENDRGLSVWELCRGQTSPGAGRGLAPGGGSVLEKSLTVWSRSAEPPPQVHMMVLDVEVISESPG